MSNRDYRTDRNLLAVSLLLKETALNTPQALSHTLLVDRGDIMQLKHRRQTNADEATGYLEPDNIYNLGNLSEISLNFNEAKPQDFLLAYGYGLGNVVSSAWGAGYKHIITRLPGSILPGFTGGQQLGDTIRKTLCSSFFIDQVTSSFAKDSWAKVSASVKGTGKYAENITEETLTAAYNAASLTLAANGVQGSSAALRLENVHQIRVQVPTTLEWVEVAYSSVSADTPAVIAITAPGGAATPVSYKITYAPTEPAWCAFPARVTESPLRVTDLIVKYGGTWNGSVFLGGRTIDSEIESIEHVLNNNMAIEFRPGGTGDYANFAERGDITQTIKLNRQMRDAILQQRIKNNETFGVYLKLTGPEWATGYNYFVELVFPKCGLLDAPISVNNKKLAEAGDLQVLEDPTYGSVQVTIANKIATCAA